MKKVISYEELRKARFKEVVFFKDYHLRPGLGDDGYSVGIVIPRSTSKEEKKRIAERLYCATLQTLLVDRGLFKENMEMLDLEPTGFIEDPKDPRDLTLITVSAPVEEYEEEAKKFAECLENRLNIFAGKENAKNNY